MRTTAPAEASRPRRDRPGRQGRSRWRDELGYFVALSPATVILVLFFIFPALWAIYASLTSLELAGLGATETRWVGLENYRRLWNDPDFPMIGRNTVVFVLGAGVIGQSGLGLTLALLLDHARAKRYRLAGVAYGAVLLAWICPPALAAFIWGGIYDYDDGPINAVLETVSLGPIDMLGSAPMLSVILAEVWRGVAFAMLIFLAALQMIPPAAYEAARVDGADAW
ncbi:MAG: carbohydrate ABC transporter permease, partial [Thermomicrobiales bacterium]